MIQGKTYVERVYEEQENFNDAYEHAIDHLEMADSILFEELEGREDEIRSDIAILIRKIRTYKNSAT